MDVQHREYSQYVTITFFFGHTEACRIDHLLKCTGTAHLRPSGGEHVTSSEVGMVVL